jgi:hypothetical protein
MLLMKSIDIISMLSSIDIDKFVKVSICFAKILKFSNE